MQINLQPIFFLSVFCVLLHAKFCLIVALRYSTFGLRYSRTLRCALRLAVVTADAGASTRPCGLCYSRTPPAAWSNPVNQILYWLVQINLRLIFLFFTSCVLLHAKFCLIVALRYSTLRSALLTHTSLCPAFSGCHRRCWCICSTFRSALLTHPACGVVESR